MKRYITPLMIIFFIVLTNNVISEEIFTIFVSPDGNKVVVYKQLGIDVVNLNTQQIISFIPINRENRLSSRWSPDSNYVAIATSEATIQVWNINNGTLIAILTGHPQGNTINALEWYNDKLYSMTLEGSLLIWDMITYQYIDTFSIGGNDLEVNPTGDKLAIASFFNIAILDLNNMTLESFTAQTEQILSVSWSPDGQKIASSSVDGKIQVWDLNDTNTPETVISASNVLNELRWVTELHWNNGYLAVRQIYNDSVVILDNQTGGILDTILVENGRFIWSDNIGYYAIFRNEPIQLHKYCDEITPPEDTLGISQAITTGNSGSFGNTICLAPNGTYTLTAPLPNVTGDITIIGNGATLTMTGGAQIFTVSETGGLTLKNITVSGGFAVQGGAIFNAGTLVLEDVVLENNSATDGGAIYNTGSLTMTRGALQNNTATNFGGGIYNVGETLDLDGVNIRDNDAVEGSGVYQGE